MRLRTIVVFCAAAFACAVSATAGTYNPYETFARFDTGQPPNAYRSADGRPGPSYWQNRADYVIKELIPDMELGPQAALDKAIAIAKRGDVATIYLNADLAHLPKLQLAATG